MAPPSVHQAIHGYRDGHRLLSSSTPLSADAMRSMLVLSDMSGPATQPGFDEYLTGYPLPGSEFFVLAKTWYAPEMQRPGCVWTHSLLIPRAQVSRLPTSCLLRGFRRPQIEAVEKAAATPIVFDNEGGGSAAATDGFGDRTVAVALVGAVFGQPRPVIVAADTAAQLEPAILRLWEELWPAERARFSFCTGALMPRSNAGALLDLQAVPRAVSSSQFRKSASTALVLDLQAPNKPEAWVELVLDSALRGDAAFRNWLEAAAGAEASRSAVPNLAPIFAEWHAPSSSAQSVLASVVRAEGLDPSARVRLVSMAFDRAEAEAGAVRQRELLQDLCGRRDVDLALILPTLEEQTKRLFERSRAEGVALAISLLGSELTEVGEHVVRAAVLLLAPSDVETLGDGQTPFLPTIVGVNPALASSPVLWKRVGSRGGEILGQLGALNLGDDERGAIVEAILESGRDVSVDALVRFGRKVAIVRGLASLTAGRIQLSWPWRSALSAQADTVLEWVESLSSPSLRDLEVASQFLSPKANQARLARVWKTGTAGAGVVMPRVAAFGLTLALWEGVADSPLLAACFQPTYDAAGNSRLEYEEWDWLRDYSPSLSWYRDWDRCERLITGVARLFEKQSASLETVFSVVQKRAPIRRLATILEGDRNTRCYVESLRKAASATPGVGTREQRDALLESS